MTEYYKGKMEYGLEYQDFICDYLRIHYGMFVGPYSSRKYQFKKGESQMGLEIKYDMLMRQTGNLFIEIAEKPNADYPTWIPSGVYRPDNSWLYLVGDYNEAFIFSKQQLQNLINNDERRKQHQMKRKEIPCGTSIGYTYPIEMALKTGSCIKHIIIEGENNNA